jgi:hypothetical protein
MHVDCRRKLEMAEDLFTFCPPGSAGAVLAEKLRAMAWANVPDGYDAVVQTVTHPEAAALLTSTNPAEIRRFQTWETWFHKQAPAYPSVVGRTLQQLPDRWREELHVALARLNGQMSWNSRPPAPPVV